MIAVVQRVKAASVTADGAPAGKCGHGLLVLLGVLGGDEARDAEILAEKIAKLRIFTDENDKMNRSVLDIGGGVLAVSNFTLGADIKKGNRPSFTGAAAPEIAAPLYTHFCEELRRCGVSTETGVFGADMQIDMTADGPVTIVMNTEIWKK
ncbi:MAG: D-tyrosyl-tRNA(Tyr) deacylase [Clostridia bacterium]|nr:D-tyrosyl-tRNA(Tyr) deacylase [Clostridia bacterium]